MVSPCRALAGIWLVIRRSVGCSARRCRQANHRGLSELCRHLDVQVIHRRGERLRHCRRVNCFPLRGYPDGQAQIEYRHQAGLVNYYREWAIRCRGAVEYHLANHPPPDARRGQMVDLLHRASDRH